MGTFQQVIEDVLKTYVVPKLLVIFQARALLTYSSGLFSLKGLGLRKQQFDERRRERPEGRFSKDPITYRARKVIL